LRLTLFIKILVQKINMGEYKIRDLETLTGVKAHTLRIWEKRYGLIRPERTDTQIRTYSDHELVTLLNVALLNKNGLKISKIARMTPEQLAAKVVELKNDRPSDSYTEMLILALVELDELLFNATFGAVVKEFGLEKAFASCIVPFFERIGVMWLVGTINPAQEHFISTLIRQKVIVEIDKLPVPPRQEHPVVLFTPEHEWHEIGLLFYNYILRSMGIYTVYLGQSVPFDSIVDVVAKMQPSALVTSWVTAVDKKFMKHYFEELENKANGATLIAGGFQLADIDESLKKRLSIVQSVADIRQYFI
jgi:DNA-binding transcriptional MerR regulator/methylmalonyl-CoA mutase cobalamin-binding subunit